MNGLKQWTISILLLASLIACSNQDTTDEAGNTETANDSAEEVTISLTITDQTTNTVIDEEDYTVEEGSDLLSIMEDNYDQVEVTDDGFLTGIEGYQQDMDNNIFWLYQVNGEDGTVGMAEYEVSEQDEISVDLQELE